MLISSAFNRLEPVCQLSCSQGTILCISLHYFPSSGDYSSGLSIGLPFTLNVLLSYSWLFQHKRTMLLVIPVMLLSLLPRERTIIGSVSYRNRYWVYRFESYRLLLCLGKPDITCITADSAAVNRSHYTGDQRTFAPRHPPRGRHLIHDTGEGWRGGRRETVTWYQPPHDTKTAQYWVLATSDRWCRTPSTSRKW